MRRRGKKKTTEINSTIKAEDITTENRDNLPTKGQEQKRGMVTL